MSLRSSRGTSTKQALMQLQPYLFLDGRCEEAIEFYRRTLGAELTTLMRFNDNPEPAMAPPGSGEKVTHAHYLFF